MPRPKNPKHCLNEFPCRMHKNGKNIHHSCLWTPKQEVWSKGLHYSEEKKARMRETALRLGVKPPIPPKGRKPWNTGLKGVPVAGEKSHLWKGGISQSRNYRRLMKLAYRGKKYNAEGSHTKKDWEEIKKKFLYMCLCCKRIEPEIKLTEDHIIPLSLGGSDFVSNIQPLCRSCNSRKKDKYIDYISPYQDKLNTKV